MELSGLKNELRHLLVIAQQLEPYIRSISSLMERIQPQVGASQEEVEEEEETRPVRDQEPPAVSVRNSENYQHTRTRESPPPPPPVRSAEDERIMSILERIQSMKPDYKQRYSSSRYHSQYCCNTNTTLG